MPKSSIRDVRSLQRKLARAESQLSQMSQNAKTNAIEMARSKNLLKNAEAELRDFKAAFQLANMSTKKVVKKPDQYSKKLRLQLKKIKRFRAKVIKGTDEEKKACFREYVENCIVVGNVNSPHKFQCKVVYQHYQQWCIQRKKPWMSNRGHLKFADVMHESQSEIRWVKHSDGTRYFHPIEKIIGL